MLAYTEYLHAFILFSPIFQRPDGPSWCPLVETFPLKKSVLQLPSYSLSRWHDIPPFFCPVCLFLCVLTHSHPPLCSRLTSSALLPSHSSYGSPFPDASMFSQLLLAINYTVSVLFQSKLEWLYRKLCSHFALFHFGRCKHNQRVIKWDCKTISRLGGGLRHILGRYWKVVNAFASPGLRYSQEACRSSLLQHLLLVTMAAEVTLKLFFSMHIKAIGRKCTDCNICVREQHECVLVMVSRILSQ